VTKLVFGGVPLWLMRKYLKSLGASAVAENTFVFPDAEVMLSEVEPLCVGSLTVGRLEVGVRASSAEREATLVAAIRLKALRGGG